MEEKQNQTGAPYTEGGPNSQGSRARQISQGLESSAVGTNGDLQFQTELVRRNRNRAVERSVQEKQWEQGQYAKANSSLAMTPGREPEQKKEPAVEGASPNTGPTAPPTSGASALANTIRGKTAPFEKRNRATYTTMLSMITVFVMFDVLQVLLNFIPVAGWILSFLVGIVGQFTWYIWNILNGWTTITGKSTSTGGKVSGKIMNVIIQWVAPIAEMIPIVDDLPIFTAKVIFKIYTIRAEDAVYNLSHGKLN